MPVVCFNDIEVIEWEITLTTVTPVTTSPRQITLRFRIDAMTGSDISGKVRFNGMEVADFTGTCTSVVPEQVNDMSFVFPFGRANISIRGIAFARAGQPNRFVGDFEATPRTDLREPENFVVALPPPDPGDTGIGNGTQT